MKSKAWRVQPSHAPTQACHGFLVGSFHYGTVVIADEGFARCMLSAFRCSEWRFAGRITDYAGAFVQGAYSGVDRAFLLDNTDIRLTTPLSLGDTEFRVGASINNGSTVEDTFNSTPVWMFPFASSSLAPTPKAQTLLGGRQLVGNSLGLTVYGWYDQRIYLEAGGYARPFVNLKIGLQYVAYTMFNGGTQNYDGFGRNASGNNTAFLYAWMAF